MNLKLLIVFGVILFALVGYFFYEPSYPIANHPPKNQTIVAFGDSLVFGYGAEKGNDFPTLLGTRLNREVINQGVSGNTTADGVARLEDVMELNPGTVILLLGGNDTLRRIPVSETEQNLRTILETLRNEGTVIVLVGVRGGVFSNEREEAYERLSEEYGAVYVEDILDGIFLKPDLMFDAIHPNDAGYARIAERLHTVFTKNNL